MKGKDRIKTWIANNIVGLFSVIPLFSSWITAALKWINNSSLNIYDIILICLITILSFGIIIKTIIKKCNCRAVSYPGSYLYFQSYRFIDKLISGEKLEDAHFFDGFSLLPDEES